MTSPQTTPQTTSVTVGGHTYRVNSSANTDELARLAALVDERLAALPIGQRGDPKSLVLVALGLAHDLEQERRERSADRQDASARIRSIVARIGDALGNVDQEGNPLDAPATLNAPAHPATGADADGSQPRSLQTVPRQSSGRVSSKRSNKTT